MKGLKIALHIAQICFDVFVIGYILWQRKYKEVES